MKNEPRDYFLEDTAARLQSIEIGNAVQGQVSRDLSLRKKEYWETRPSPAMPHHWTASEFLKHLVRHNFPAGTIRERMALHQASIQKALERGEFVPEIVLNSEAGRHAVSDAQMMILAQDQACRKDYESRQRAAKFKESIGELDHHGLNKNLRETIVSCASKSWVLPGVKLISIDGYPDDVYCVFDRLGVTFKDASIHVESLYGVLHRVKKSEVSNTIQAALHQGRISFDDALSLMGLQWHPLVVDSCN